MHILSFQSFSDPWLGRFQIYGPSERSGSWVTHSVILKHMRTLTVDREVVYDRCFSRSHQIYAKA